MSRFEFLEKYAVDGDHYDSATELKKMSTSQWKTDRYTAATHSKLSPDSAHELSHDVAEWVRQGVARNRATPHHVLDHLSNDDDYEVRGEVARNPSTHSDTLQRMITHGNPSMNGYVMSKLMSNPAIKSLHVNTLAKKSLDKNDMTTLLDSNLYKHSLLDKSILKNIPNTHPELHKMMQSWYPNTYHKIFSDDKK